MPIATLSRLILKAAARRKERIPHGDIQIFVSVIGLAVMGDHQPFSGSGKLDPQMKKVAFGVVPVRFFHADPTA
jgi:hypothetical protein